jgi:hypothetical protein
MRTIHAYEVRPRKDKRGVDLIADALESFLIAQSRSSLNAPAIETRVFYAEVDDKQAS